MKAAGYHALTFLSKRIGFWILRFGAWWISTAYFFLFPRRVATSVRFYGALFPERSLPYHLWCAWRQYHNFTHIYIDRFFLEQDEKLSVAREGWRYLEQAVEEGTGGILVMSHVGNWEIASRLLKHYGQGNPKMRLLLYLGQRHKEQIEREQKETLVRSGLTVIAVEPGGGSPADIVEGVKFLKAGGLVSLTGDRLWREDQRRVPVSFLGRRAFLPELPFVLALLSGAPIFVFFAYRTGTRAYRIETGPPEFIRAPDRRMRDEAIRQVAQSYADRLEALVRQYPFEWFHFEPFIGEEPLQPGDRAER